jgi:hypothetical protein
MNTLDYLDGYIAGMIREFVYYQSPVMAGQSQVPIYHIIMFLTTVTHPKKRINCQSSLLIGVSPIHHHDHPTSYSSVTFYLSLAILFLN